MGYLSILLNIIKSITQVREIWKIISSYRYSAVILITASLGAAYFASDAVKQSMHNKKYNITVDLDNAQEYIDKILRQCGDKTGITISPISFNLDYNLDSYGGRFYIARACDSREVKNNCIVNLKDAKPNPYAQEQNVDPNSYNFLKRIGDQTNASRFYLRNKLNEQDISSLDKFISLKELVAKTDWYEEGILYNLWVTSILSDDSVLYVISYLSGTRMEESACFNPSIILNDIKQYITK